VAEGRIIPHRTTGEILEFDGSECRISNESRFACDYIVDATGAGPPEFPFFAPEVRELLCGEDGVQLYRHLIHPDIPALGFAGFNHGFMHIPAAEIGALWLSATIDGYLALPSRSEMQASITRVTEWKRLNIEPEPSLLCAVSTRFQQYLDILLGDLGISPYRKSTAVAELLSPYTACDYRSVVKEYMQRRDRQVRRPGSLDT
jgi:hypothetical protein